MGTFWSGLWDLLYPPPPTCALCGGEAPGDCGGICPACLQRLADWRLGYRPCPTCGRFLSPPSSCGRCKEQPPPFQMARAVGPYQGDLGRALRNLKFHGQRHLATPLGRLLVDLVRREPALLGMDLIVPVPLAPDRQRGRGFNQAELLAGALGRELGRKVRQRLLVKTRSTLPQTGLSRERRLLNLEGAFKVTRPWEIRDKGVLLVDDILTTGATASRCAHALLAAGAGKVGVVTVAASVERQRRSVV